MENNKYFLSTQNYLENKQKKKKDEKKEVWFVD